MIAAEKVKSSEWQRVGFYTCARENKQRDETRNRQEFGKQSNGKTVSMKS